MLFVWNNAVLGLLAARLARRALPHDGRILQGTAAILLFVAGAAACLFIAASSGSLTAPVVGLLASLALAVELVATQRWPLPEAQDSPSDAVDVAAGAVLATVVGMWGVTLLWLPTTFEWDDLTYHAATPGWWLYSESLSPSAFTYQAYYPYNAELASFWFALPTHSDAHVGVAIFLWVAMLVGAGLSISQGIRQSFALSAAALLAFLASPQVRELGSSFSANDLCVAATALAALALAYSPERDRSQAARALLCGIAAGYAVGAKVSIAPVAGLLLLWWVAIGARQRRPLVPALFLVGLLAFGSGWYIRNGLLAGNPLFPAEFGPFEGPFDLASQRETSILGVLERSDNPKNLWSRLVWQRFDWPYPLGIAAAFGYLAAVVGAWLRDRREAAYLLLIAGAGLLVVALYPATPFSGTTNRPHGHIHVMVRYLTFSFAVGLVLLPSALPSRWFPRSGLQVAVPRSRWWPVALIVALVALAASTPAKHAANTAGLYGHDTAAGRIGGGWEALERLPDGAKIASYSNNPGSHAFYYPLFGRRFQHEPIGVLPDGRPRGLLHDTWRDRPERWWWEYKKTDATGRHLVSNLRQTGVTHVLVTRRRDKSPWPRQRLVIQDKVGGEPLYSGRLWEIWEIR